MQPTPFLNETTRRYQQNTACSVKNGGRFLLPAAVFAFTALRFVTP